MSLEPCCAACPDGCCVGVVDSELKMGSAYGRHMFEVIEDPAVYLDQIADHDYASGSSMVVIWSAEYDSPDVS